jgi:ATP-dependent DNA helicase RecQ
MKTMKSQPRSSQEIHKILKQYWGFDSFRAGQEEIIQSILNGNDTLALMPTGGGKSLCYQVPVMAMKGIGLVISPLIALMKDQVENLRRKNITAFAIYSGMTVKEVTRVLQLAGDSNCKFLFVSPERLETKRFLEYLPGLDISLIAVDEAHCISQWGYDFRPPYLRIAKLRESLGDIPVLALTASATPEVQSDICQRLTAAKRNWTVFKQSFERPNLSYSVFHNTTRMNKILEILQNVKGTAIIYCRSRKRTKEIADLLKLQGIGADHYHAGLSADKRNTKQENWINNKTRVIVCTNAFGMGIDKPDVRVVIHADLPDCLENYYQEAGRAGRDGKRSYAVLLADEKDTSSLENTIESRFPSLEKVREVYQAIANYLQVPSGSAQGNYFDFDLQDFLSKFRIPVQQVLYSIKALEAEDILSFNEQVFMSSTVVFSVSKNELYAFEEQQPLFNPLIKTLLRSYEGIFDQPVAISEKLLTGILKKELHIIQQELQQLDGQGIIDYVPQKDSPQLFFSRERLVANELRLDEKARTERKKQYQLRIQKMIAFVNENKTCRSRIIGSYFGDEAIPECGICDNCLLKKNSKMGKDEFEAFRIKLVELLKVKPLPVKELTSKLGLIKKEKAWRVLEFLQAEKVIEMNESGIVRLIS